MKIRKTLFSPLILMAALNSSMGFAQNSVTESDASKIVNHCVDVVHKTRPSPALIATYGPVIASFFQNFDAFYNPASGLVQNNAGTVGSQPALFAFQRCMAESGLPLK